MYDQIYYDWPEVSNVRYLYLIEFEVRPLNLTTHSNQIQSTTHEIQINTVMRLTFH